MDTTKQITTICKKVLGERYNTRALPANCKMAIIIPVFNENIEMVTQLVDSLTTQQSINTDEIAVFMVVNNDMPDTKNYPAIYAANQKILQYDWAKHANIALHLIDCSSKNREIPNCSVGAARDIGLHVATLSFADVGVNGILIHVDADTSFKDSHYLKKALNLFSDPDVIGVAGGKNREVVLSEYPVADYPNREALTDAFRMQATAGKCRYLLKFIERDDFLFRVFTGTNMLGRAFESVLAGGIPHINYLEDWQYGFRLWDYAVQHQQRVVVDRSLRVSASFRISERTGSSFKDAIHDLIQGKLPTAKNPITGELLTLDNTAYVGLRKEALALPHGENLVAYMDDYDITIL